jgi:hypothetical protein
MSPEALVIWFGGLATLGIFSFIWKENPVYRFFEHLFMGLSLGWGIVLTWVHVLEPHWLKPIGGALTGDQSAWHVLRILILPVGAMWYFIFTRKLRWIARILIGFFIGVGAGLGIQGFFRIYLPQITASFKSLWPKRETTGETVWAAFSNLVFTITFYTSMAYFLFTFKRSGPVLRGAARIGRWLMMIAFGAMFGSTVMARLSLFIERMQFLLHDLIGISR